MAEGHGYVWGPTYEEMLHPRASAAPRESAPAGSSSHLNPRLFDITWRDASGAIRYEVLPPELTNIAAPIVVLYGKDFPSGSHKVGAAYSVLLEKQLAGEVKPGYHTLIWPSTGNYGIGGTWVGGQMGYDNVVVLPARMSQERFDLLASHGARIQRTPGTGSNVREIYQRTRQLREADPEHVVILNQFQEMGNYRFHYYVTGGTIIELTEQLQKRGLGRGRVAAFCSAMGSGGTIAAGDRLKQVWPDTRVVGLEPVQCPTLYNAGYGTHEIQGIGDKHVTWIHNVLNMDAIACVDDQACLKGLQLLTEETGWETLIRLGGIPEHLVTRLARIVGISGVCNILGAAKVAQYYQLGRDDLVVTVCTDAIERYHSVMASLNQRLGPMDEVEAAARLDSIFRGQTIDWIAEGTVARRQRWHNQKYFTWVEQLGKSVADLDAQRDPAWWVEQQSLIATIDDALRKTRPAG